MKFINKRQPKYFLHGHIHKDFENDADRITVVGKTKVINVSAKDRKIGLSIKALTDAPGEGSMNDYQKEEQAGPSTLGDLLQSQLGDTDEE